MSAELLVAITTSPDGSNALRRTLASLASCEIPPSFRGAVVADTDPWGAAEEVVNEFAQTWPVTYFRIPGASTGAALNAALRFGEDALVLFTEGDVRFAPQALVAYAEGAGRTASGAFYGGPCDVTYDSQPPQWLTRYLPRQARAWSLERLEDRAMALHPCKQCLLKSEVRKPVFVGFNWAAFERDISAVGGFDPRYGEHSASGALGHERQLQRRLLAADVHARYVPEGRACRRVPASECSPDWLAHRAFGYGVALALELAQDELTLGWPLGLVTHCWRQILARALAFGRADSVVALEARIAWQFLKGYAQGRRTRAALPALIDPDATVEELRALAP